MKISGNRSAWKCFALIACSLAVSGCAGTLVTTKCEINGKNDNNGKNGNECKNDNECKGVPFRL